MASYWPPVKGSGYIFYVALRQQADTKLFQANPTLAAGDVKVSTDGGAFANITTLPSADPAGGVAVKVTVSDTEMNGDNVVITFIDAAGAEWCDLTVSIQTVGQTMDDISDDIVALPTAANNADAVLDELTEDHTTDGSLGERVQNIDDRQTYSLGG